MTEETAKTATDVLLAEDLMLLLFQPASGTISGEGTLYYVLAGALLTELAQKDLVSAEKTAMGAKISAVGETAPTDPLLAEMWQYVAEKTRGAQGVLAAIGPKLRGPILGRLVERGDITSEERRILGIPSPKLSAGTTGRREELIARVRAVLVDGAEPDDTIGALIALLSASNALPTMHKDIPWGSVVAERAKSFEKGDWGAEAAGTAVTRTMNAIIVNSVVASVVVSATVANR